MGQIHSNSLFSVCRLGLFLTALALSQPALAQEQQAQTPPTPKQETTIIEVSQSEKAVLAFFRLAGREPNYDDWVINAEKYKNAEDKFERQKILLQERSRLQSAFQYYDPKTSYLPVSTRVYLQYAEQGSTNLLLFKFVETAQTSDIPYFPYPYGDEWIALIVSDLKDFSAVDLQPESAAFVKQHMDTNRVYTGRLTLQVTPKGANAQTPLAANADEPVQWALSGSVAYIGYTLEKPGKEDVLIWDYAVPSYQPAPR